MVGIQKGNGKIHFNKSCHSAPKDSFQCIKIKYVKNEKNVCKYCITDYNKQYDENTDWDLTDEEDEEKSIEKKEVIDNPKYMLGIQKGNNKIHFKAGKCNRIPSNGFHKLNIFNINADNVSNCCRDAFRELKKTLEKERNSEEEERNRVLSPIRKKNVERQNLFIVEDDVSDYEDEDEAKDEYYDEKLENLMHQNDYLLKQVKFLSILVSNLLNTVENRTIDDYRKLSDFKYVKDLPLPEHVDFKNFERHTSEN